MKSRTLKVFFLSSLILNLVISIPAVVIFCGSRSIQFTLYHDVLAPRFGKPKTVFIGDSLTRQGGLWGWRLGRFDFGVRNLGVKGWTVRQMQHAARWAARSESVTIAFVMGGTNSFDNTKEGAESTFEDYKFLLSILTEANITPVISLMPYRESEEHYIFVDTLNLLLKNYGAEEGIAIIDLNRSLSPDGALLGEYSQDGVHLTEAAYGVWAKEVRSLLEKN